MRLTRVRPSARLDVIEVQSVNEQRPLSAQASARVGSADFAVVYDRYHEALYRYCWSILHQREDAQDALQSTMERAFVALQRERREIEWRPWLFCIARNEAVSILRRRRDTYALRDTAAPGGDIGESLFAREEIRALQSDLANLSERQHAALVMREVNGLGLEEIARLLGCSAAAAKQAIFEARGALLKCREGREMACADVRRALSDGDRRRLRGHGLRSHLRACGACRGFQAALKDRARAPRALFPPLSALAAAFQKLLPGTGAWSAVTAGGAAPMLVAKLAVVAAVAVAGVEIAEPGASATRSTASGVRVAATPPAPGSVAPAPHHLARRVGPGRPPARQRRTPAAPAGGRSRDAPAPTPSLPAAPATVDGDASAVQPHATPAPAQERPRSGDRGDQTDTAPPASTGRGTSSSSTVDDAPGGEARPDRRPSNPGRGMEPDGRANGPGGAGQADPRAKVPGGGPQPGGPQGAPAQPPTREPDGARPRPGGEMPPPAPAAGGTDQARGPQQSETGTAAGGQPGRADAGRSRHGPRSP